MYIPDLMFSLANTLMEEQTYMYIYMCSSVSSLSSAQDLMAILPMVDPLWKMEVTGEQILLALENGVSQYPNLEGRFPQVSGISFTFDPSQPSGSRVSENSVLIGGEKLQRTRTYTLCTKGYIAGGKDGYSVFKDAKTLLDHEAGIILNSVVRNHFQSCRQNQSRSHSRCDNDNPLQINTEPSRSVCVYSRDTGFMTEPTTSLGG